MEYVRVVRFTDVDLERIESIRKQIDEADGPPEGVPSTGIDILVDEDQRTAVVVQYYNSMDDLQEGERVFAAMDASETPGTRESVDRCAVRVHVRM